MDYGAAVEISGFSGEQDGFGSVQHRTNVSALPAWKAGRESEHLASRWAEPEPAGLLIG